MKTPTQAAVMIAKVQLASVEPTGEGENRQERLNFHGVAKDGSYPSDGSDEENTFAKFSPSLDVGLTIANPALLDQFKAGQKFYLMFHPVDEPAQEAAQGEGEGTQAAC